MADEKQIAEKESVHPNPRGYVNVANKLREDVDNRMTGLPRDPENDLAENIRICFNAIAMGVFTKSKMPFAGEDKEVEVFSRGYDLLEQMSIVLSLSTWARLLGKPHILKWLEENRPHDVKYRLECCEGTVIQDAKTHKRMVFQNGELVEVMPKDKKEEAAVPPLVAEKIYGLKKLAGVPATKEATIKLTAKEKVSDVKEIEDNYDRAMKMFANMKSFLGG